MKGIYAMIDELINKLSNRFTETIFYKDGSELEQQIDALETLLKKYPNNAKLINELNNCKAGLQGEKEIRFELSNANIGMYVLHDVNMQYEDLKAQIDYIIITPAYTYFVECKRIAGNVFVDSNGNFNRAYYKDGQRVIEGMASPLRQAQRHVEVYKKIWTSRNNTLVDRLLRQDRLDEFNKPLVVFANAKNTVDLKNAPKEYRNKVVKSDNLVELLKREYKQCDKDYLWDKKQMENVAYSIMANYNKMPQVDYIKKYEELIKNQCNDSNELKIIKEELLSFREKKSKERNIPEDYIFTDDELEVIIKLMPKTKNELVNAKILSDVKLKYHGDEIVNIIVHK